MKINRSFTVLESFNVIKAHEIFQTRAKINKIPIINKSGELIGDYSRWDDKLFIERNHSHLMCYDAVKKVLASYDMVYLIEPISDKKPDYMCLVQYLEKFQIDYILLKKEQIGEKLLNKAVFIFWDEDERRGIQCLYGIKLKGDYTLPDTQWNVRFATYKNLLLQMMQETQLERLKIKTDNNKINEKATILLSELKKRGVNCFYICDHEKESTKYWEVFHREVREKIDFDLMSVENGQWPKAPETFKKFLVELWQQEDYVEGVVQEEVSRGDLTFEYKMDISGKYFNAKQGRRITCFQPEKYIGTIYILGPCIAIGALVEDQYTIGSYLQKKLLERGYAYKVENCGALMRPDSRIDDRLAEINKYHKSDIVIVFSRDVCADIEGCSIEGIFERYQIPSGWVTNYYIHCNHKVNQLVADSILEMIEPCLANEMVEYNDEEAFKINIANIMKDYVWNKYLSQYFMNFPSKLYSTIGAIVMNCNPFSRGHRYLIEQASQQVDFLIIFAVEEDESLFPFEERFKMIVEGTKDLDNIMVVPSGDFILSKDNFQEYFTKQESEAVAFNAEYDISVFVDYIARPLHITHRFVGEEPEDRVTRVYNDTMRKLLPSKGIVFVEIPRIETESEIISASRVRTYLNDEEYDKAFTLLPETTKQYLMKQIF